MDLKGMSRSVLKVMLDEAKAEMWNATDEEADAAIARADEIAAVYFSTPA